MKGWTMDPRDIQVGEEVLYTVMRSPHEKDTGFLVHETTLQDVAKQGLPVTFPYDYYHPEASHLAGTTPCYIVFPYAVTGDDTAGYTWASGFVVLASEVVGPAPKQSRFTAEERRRQREESMASLEAEVKVGELHHVVCEQERQAKGQEEFSPEAYPWAYAERYVLKHQRVLTQEVLHKASFLAPDRLFLPMLLDTYPPKEQEQVLVSFANLLLKEERIHSTPVRRRKAYQATRGKQPPATLFF